MLHFVFPDIGLQNIFRLFIIGALALFGKRFDFLSIQAQYEADKGLAVGTLVMEQERVTEKQG
ncbi:MAG TPA: hypothetical protein H9739_09270 [Candidatus Agathobaculum pullistercoris]|nr:hypothetical protein [uncultured Agathobaculum sp.]HIX11758.1 hypothetical protein [Candidatus Agathobaculum pullistercoris]